MSASSAANFTDPRLHKLDGFRVEVDGARERADIVLDRPPLNVIEMDERDQLRLVFEALDEDARVRVIVLRAAGEHFSSGGNIAGFTRNIPTAIALETSKGEFAEGIALGFMLLAVALIVNFSLAFLQGEGGLK